MPMAARRVAGGAAGITPAKIFRRSFGMSKPDVFLSTYRDAS